MFSLANECTFFLEVEGLDSTRLQVLAFDGLESLNADYAFEITLVNDYVRYDITKLLSKAAYLSFTADKTQGVHGIIQAVKRGTVSPHYAEYKIILTPQFSHLYKRMNQRAFVHKTVPEIITTILNEHGLFESSQFEFKFKDKNLYTPREFCCQYNESDAAYVHRLCEECGIAIHYEFTPKSHKLIFSDAQPFFSSLLNPLIYRADSGFVADKPVLKRFDIGLVSAPITASERNYNFKNKKIPEASYEGTQSNKANHAVEPLLEHYHFPGRLVDKNTANQQAQLSIERLRSNHILAEAYGDTPELHAGCYFSVENFPAIDTMAVDEPWLIKQIKHQGRQPQVLEAFGSAASADSQLTPTLLYQYFKHPIVEELQFPNDNLQQGYRNCFVATPQAVVYRPQRLHFKHKVLGAQTAIVTGPDNEEIYCDEYGRVKVQFHWDREGSYDEYSSHWIRVANIWAHHRYGSIEIPRIGMEVMVDFIEGDIDNPIIRGAVHNGVNLVPYDLPAIKTQSTLKSKEYKGTGYNELLIDDTTGEIKTQLHSTYEASQLTLGFLTHPRKKEGGGEHRGHGFELRTDAWGAIRAAKGLYVSTDERKEAKGIQLDLQEAINQLKSSLALAKNLAKAAERAHAFPSDIDDQNSQLENVFTELKESGILAHAPAGIALTTPRSIQLTADKNLTMTANLNTDISAVQDYRVAAGGAVSLLATNNEMKLVAHKDKIKIQANDNNIELMADKTVKIVSTNDQVMVSADKELLLTCGGAYIKLANGNIHLHAPGVIDNKASSFPYQGPTSVDVGFEGLPKGDTYDLQIKLIDEATGQLIKNTKYQMHLSNGRIIEGISDNRGLTSRIWGTEKLLIDKIVLLDYTQLTQ